MSKQRKNPLAAIVAAVILLLISSLACSTLSTAPASTPSGEEMMGTVEAYFTSTAAAANNQTATPVSTLAPQSAAGIRTAEEMRSLGRVTGWVTGGDGQYVAGAQLELKNDTPLLDILQDGTVYEFQCVHYLAINGEVHAKPVCEDGLVRFDTNSVLPKGAIGTIWLPWAVKGDSTEKWEEGFLNAPCACADGDCRD